MNPNREVNNLEKAPLNSKLGTGTKNNLSFSNTGQCDCIPVYNRISFSPQISGSGIRPKPDIRLSFKRYIYLLVQLAKNQAGRPNDSFLRPSIMTVTGPGIPVFHTVTGIGTFLKSDLAPHVVPHRLGGPVVIGHGSPSDAWQ